MQRKTWWIADGILLLALICSVVIYFARTWQYHDWVSTPGVVTGIQHYSGSKHNNASHRIYFSFSVDGKIYQGNSLYAGISTDVTEGEQTEVWYNPENPNQSSFSQPNPGLDPYGPWFLAIPAVLLVLGLGRKRNSKLS